MITKSRTHIKDSALPLGLSKKSLQKNEFIEHTIYYNNVYKCETAKKRWWKGALFDFSQK